MRLAKPMKSNYTCLCSRDSAAEGQSRKAPSIPRNTRHGSIYAKQKGYNGVRSGDLLQSPEITYKVWDKFSNKELIGTFGEHSFNFGETIRNPKNRVTTIFDGNVYRLTTPTKFIPTKNEWMFHPSIIDKNTGKLQPPNWNDRNIYKVTLPAGISTNYLNNKLNEE